MAAACSVTAAPSHVVVVACVWVSFFMVMHARCLSGLIASGSWDSRTSVLAMQSRYIAIASLASGVATVAGACRTRLKAASPSAGSAAPTLRHVSSRRRLDADLVRRGLMPSRDHARKAVIDRQVLVNGAVAQKPTHMVAAGDQITLLAPPPRFVGRGGLKLEGALAAFGVDVAGMSCIDVGSSTGGFTDCLLQGKAASVLCVDVGRAQLHERLRASNRVIVRERTDIRKVKPDKIGAPFDLVVIDVSFIGLDNILDIIEVLAGPEGQIVTLVKPQFEAGRAEADKGKGVIRDPEVWRRVLDESIHALRRRDMHVGGVCVSPITGGAGNVEFFLWAGGSESSVPDDLADVAVNAAVADAEELA